MVQLRGSNLGTSVSDISVRLNGQVCHVVRFVVLHSSVDVSVPPSTNSQRYISSLTR